MYRLILRLWRLVVRVPGMEILLLRLFNARFIVGSSGVILDDAGRVLLFHHTYRRKYAWGLPGGWMKAGEKAAAALAREVAEESGLAVDVIAPLLVDTLPKRAVIENIFLARFVGGTFLPSAEVDECRWFDEDLPRDMKPLQKRIVEAARRLTSENRLPGRIDV